MTLMVRSWLFITLKGNALESSVISYISTKGINGFYFLCYITIEMDGGYFLLVF